MSLNIRYISCIISCLSTLLSIYAVVLNFKRPTVSERQGDIAIYSTLFCLAVFCINLLILMHGN